MIQPHHFADWSEKDKRLVILDNCLHNPQDTSSFVNLPPYCVIPGKTELHFYCTEWFGCFDSVKTAVSDNKKHSSHNDGNDQTTAQ